MCKCDETVKRSKRTFFTLLVDVHDHIKHSSLCNLKGSFHGKPNFPHFYLIDGFDMVCKHYEHFTDMPAGVVVVSA